MGKQQRHRQPHGHPSTSRDQPGLVASCVAVIRGVTLNNMSNLR